MTEHTDQILRRFSGPEWARVEALGFPVPAIGRTAIANHRAKRDAAHVNGCCGPRQHSAVMCILTRGAIELRTASMRKAAARLNVPLWKLRQVLHTRLPVRGWRVRKAAA